MPSFAEFIKRRRRELLLTQMKVAARIIQDDGKPLSMQYLNDIENGRRGAPPDYVLKTLERQIRPAP